MTTYITTAEITFFYDLFFAEKITISRESGRIRGARRGRIRAKMGEFASIRAKPSESPSIFFFKANFVNYRRTKGGRDLKSMCNRIYIFTGIFIFWSQVSTPFGSPVIYKIRFKKKN